MNNSDLNGQTAPESTRGFFDSPEDSPVMKRGDWTNKTSHYRSLDLGGQRTNSKPYVPPANAPNRSSTHRSPLHTVNEEENIMQYNRNRYSRYQDDEPAQRASIDSATSFYQRKQRSSVAHFNNFPLAAKTANSVLDNDDELANKLSREYVLAQTEAKLTGHSAANHHQTRQQNVYHTTGNNLDETRFLDQYRRSQTQEKQNRRLSEPNPRMYYQQYPQQFQQQQHDSSDDISRGGRHSNVLNKRMSFQYNLSDAAADTNRSKPHQKATLSLDLSAHQKANTGRATSMDWRAPKSPTTPTRPQSARLSTSSLREEMMSNGGGNQRKPLFTSHLPFSSVVPYLKSNQLVSGLLRVNKRNRSDAYVFCEEHNADIYICGSRDRNRALEGDHVAIKLIEVEQVMLEKHEKEEAKLARNNGQPVIRKPDEEDEKEIIFGGEEDVDLVTPRFCGMVVAILDRAQKQVFSGTLGLTRPSNKRARSSTYGEDHRDSVSAPRIIWFKPTDKRVPLIAIPVEQAPVGFIENSEAFENRLFLSSIKRWPITSLHPFGVLENEIGIVDDPQVQLKAILADNNVPKQSFPESVMRSVIGTTPNTNMSTYDEVIKRQIQNNKRRDLRDVQSVSFHYHGNNSKIKENVLSVVHHGDDTYEVGLHVVDITAFIDVDSTLDKEARSRGVEIYSHLSADEVVPIWPRQLCEDHLSFEQGRDCLAFSVIWKFKDSEIVDTWFGKTVININSVMTNHQLQDIVDLDEQDSDAEIEKDIRVLYSISKLLHQKRQGKAISLKHPDIDITFRDNTPIYVAPKLNMECEVLLEEFQVLANTHVAQKICSHFPDHALLRSQSPPNERKLRELKQYINGLGYSIQIDSPSRLQHSINAIENQEARSVISTLAMKAMSQEKYFCTGTFDINRYHHYSLDEPLYTHFVSPTKRYADVVVHRQLEAYINGVDFFYMEPEIVQKTAQICNVKSRAAENAKEQTQHMFLSYYLADNTGSTTTKVEDAVVVGVQEGAFDVIVLNYGLERRIHTINLPLKSDTYSPSENVLHLVWIQNQATVDQVVEGNIESDDDDTNVDEELLVDLSDSEDNGRGGKEVHQEGKAVLGSGETNAGGDNQQQLSEAVNRLSIKSVDSGTSLGEKQQRRRSTSIRAIQGEDAWMTQKECKFPNECRQLIRPFDFVKVVITSDPIRSPPLIRVLAANPFINQEN